MSGWHERRLVSFDCETTGIDVESDRIVTAAVVTIDPLVGAVHKQEWLLDPEIEIPAGATAVHGITTEMARADGRPAAEAVGEIVSALSAAWNAGATVVVYNAPYDISLLDREYRRHWHGAPLAPGPIVDPLCCDKHYDRYRKGSRKLVDVARHYGIVLSELDAHGATADALAAARVAWKLARVYPELGAMTHEQLHAAQVGWFRTQALGLAEYFRREGKTEQVSTEWPLRPAREAVTQ
ncbi:exonuclease domain-containing protein [Amycolatopsis thailandensis]|uniref:exonuclease domain-containing protein n=1 Tax=Amycolatopsis thailandensis TaxID=589330 RepID=UPI0037B5F4E8